MTRTEINCYLTRVCGGVGRSWVEQGARNSARVAEWQEKAKGTRADGRKHGQFVKGSHGYHCNWRSFHTHHSQKKQRLCKIRSVDSKQGQPPETPPQNLSQIPMPGALWSKGSSGGGNCEAGIVKSYLGDSDDSQIEEHKKGQRDGAYQSPLDP